MDIKGGAVANSLKALGSLAYPHISHTLINYKLSVATCAFNTYPQITKMLTTTNFINTKGWE